MMNHLLREENLDPENRDELKKLGHKMLEDSLDYLKSVRNRPVWQAMPEEVKSELRITESEMLVKTVLEISRSLSS